MKLLPVDRIFDPLSNGMHNSILTKNQLEHYSTEATTGQQEHNESKVANYLSSLVR